MIYLKRALSDTFAGQFQALFVVIVGGLIGLVYLYFDQGSGEAMAEIPYWEAAVFGALGSLLLLFLWNLACAPLRIERDAHNDTRKLINVAADAEPLIEFIASRENFTLKEAACIKAGSPITHGEVTGPASGYLYDLKKKVLDGEVKASGMPDPLLASTLKFRVQNPKLKTHIPLNDHESEALGRAEVSKQELIRIGFIGEDQ